MSGLGAIHYRILAALRAHGSVTVRSFSHSPTIDGGPEFDRLPARIEELREAGHTITTRLEKTSRGKRYGRYFLTNDVVVSSVSPAGQGRAQPVTQQRQSGETLETPALFDMPTKPSSAVEAA